MIRRLESHIPKFDGDSLKFLKFFQQVLSRIDTINVPDSTKIDVVRHFLTGMANSHITEHTFTTNTWSEFKTYLLHK